MRFSAGSNPLVCDGRLAWLLDYTAGCKGHCRVYSDRVQINTEMICEEPDYFRGLDITELRVDDYEEQEGSVTTATSTETQQEDSVTTATSRAMQREANLRTALLHLGHIFMLLFCIKC